MQKSLDSFIRKRPPPESYEEEMVDHEKPQQTGTVLNTTEDSQKCYEEKWKEEGRTFHQEWRKVFSWLQFNKSKQTMSCSFCHEFSSLNDKSTSFITGSQALHIGNIKAHPSSRKHETCYAAKQQIAKQEKGSRDIV